MSVELLLSSFRANFASLKSGERTKMSYTPGIGKDLRDPDIPITSFIVEIDNGRSRPRTTEGLAHASSKLQGLIRSTHTKSCKLSDTFKGERDVRC